MPILKNPRHERFAQELASGKSAGDAYEIAGFARNRANAGKLRRQEHISIRVTELLDQRERVSAKAIEQVIERTAITKEWVLTRLRENAERAMQAEAVLDDEGKPVGEYSYAGNVANRALELLGKELGMFIDRKEVKRVDEFEGMSAEELRRYIAEKAGGQKPTRH